MAAKLVRVGEPPTQYALVSFNTLGSHVDNSIVVAGTGVAEEHARIVLGPDGWYRIRKVEGELEVDGRRIDEQVLRPGEVITIAGTSFRFVMDPVPSMAPRSEGSAAPGRIDPGWTVARVPGPVVALGGGVALVRSDGWWRRGRTRLLVDDAGQWRARDVVPDEVHGVWELGDRSLIAVGPRVSLLGRPGALRAVVHAANPAFHAVCGPSPHCIYALSGVGLHHFDGDRWRAVDLAGQGVARERGNGPVLWSDVTCDRSGRCWIVGADRKHGVLATGIGATWEAVGRAGIGALSHVAGGADGTLFVVGAGMNRGLWPVGRASHRVGADTGEHGSLAIESDARWPAYSGEWRSLGEYPTGSAWPAALGCCEFERTHALVVGWPVVGAANEVYLFLDDRWYVAPLPRDVSSARALVATSPDGRVMLAAGPHIWRSDLLLGRAVKG